MSPNESSDEADRTQLSPKSLTERLSDVEPGDRLQLNERDATFEVVGTGRYSVTVTGPQGKRLKIAQNLQSGGWSVHEPVWWVETLDTTE